MNPKLPSAADVPPGAVIAPHPSIPAAEVERAEREARGDAPVATSVSMRDTDAELNALHAQFDRAYGEVSEQLNAERERHDQTRAQCVAVTTERDAALAKIDALTKELAEAHALLDEAAAAPAVTISEVAAPAQAAVDQNAAPAEIAPAAAPPADAKPRAKK